MTGTVLVPRFLLCCTVAFLAGWVLAPAALATPPDANGVAGGGCSPDLEHRLDLTLDEALALAEDRFLYITIEDNEGDGPIVIGVGKLAPRSPDDPRGRGFQYCKMGTGYNSNWEITGEKYCFGPGESVYIGAHYEDLYDRQEQIEGYQRAVCSMFRSDLVGDYRDEYAKVDTLGIPVTLTWGEHDEVIGLKYVAELRKKTSNFIYHEIEGAAHSPQVQAVDKFNPLMLEFLRE